MSQSLKYLCVCCECMLHKMMIKCLLSSTEAALFWHEIVLEVIDPIKITGILKEQYLNVLCDHAIPSRHWLTTDTDRPDRSKPTSTFMHDNDPWHTARIYVNCLQKFTKMEVMRFSRQSLYVNHWEIVGWTASTN